MITGADREVIDKENNEVLDMELGVESTDRAVKVLGKQMNWKLPCILNKTTAKESTKGSAFLH